MLSKILKIMTPVTLMRKIKHYVLFVCAGTPRTDFFIITSTVTAKVVELCCLIVLVSFLYCYFCYFFNLTQHTWSLLIVKLM
jgi:hypothetical protein